MACGNRCFSFFISYSSVRVMTIKNTRLGITNRVVQIAIFCYAVWSLLARRSYMQLEPARGAQDIFADKHPLTVTTTPIYCDNAAYDYYFSKFWNYRDIGCRDVEMVEMIHSTANTLFVVTAVEEKLITRTNCTQAVAGVCDATEQITNYFTVDPENTIQVSFHHSYKTTWGETGFDIAAQLVDINGNVVASVEAGNPAQFFLSEYLRAAGVTSLNQEATFGGNATAKSQPRYRLIGLNLGVELEYSNVKGSVFDNTVTLRIKPVNLDNGWAQIIRPPQYLSHPNKVLSAMVQGVRFRMQVTGQIGAFNIVSLVSWLVNAVVLLGLSRVVTDFLAFNLLGEQSRVYGRTKVALAAHTELELREVDAHRRQSVTLGGALPLVRADKSMTHVTNPLDRATGRGAARR